MSKKVSIVMGVYNESKLIEGAIDSILNQTYNSFEFIIVDDGSTDQTQEIIQSYSDDRIKYIKNSKNRGLAYSLNKGIKHSEGEYIARMDADERCSPNRLQEQVEHLEQNKSTKVVASWYTVVDAEGQKIVDKKISEKKVFSLEKLLKEGAEIAHGSVMMRKDSVKEIGGYREEFDLAQDYDLWLRFAYAFDSDFMKVIPMVLYQRRISIDQLKKEPSKRFYASLAKKSIKSKKYNREFDITEEAKNAENIENHQFTRRQKAALTHYLYGIHFLKGNYRKKTIVSVFRGLIKNPLVLRLWYLLLLALLPASVSVRLSKRVYNRIATE